MTNYILQDGELYHYGIKGMKWGVRKSKAQRNADYIKKWKTKQFKRIDKDKNYVDTKQKARVEKLKNKFNKTLDRYGQPGASGKNKSTTAATKYIKAKADMLTEKRVLKKEAKKVARMKLKDIKAENKAVGKRVALETLTSIGTSAAISLFTPVTVVGVSIPNTRAVRRSNRVSDQEIRNIYEQAFKEAASDIYR